MTIYERQLCQGSITTRAVALSGARQTVVITGDLPATEKTATDLTITMTLMIGSRQSDPTKPLRWDAVAESVWTGNPSGIQPSVTWTGQAAKCSLRFDLSRPAYIDWSASVGAAQ